MGANGLSRYNPSLETPVRFIEDVYAVDELDHDGNKSSPIAMHLVKEEQDKGDNLPQLLSKPEAAASLTTKEYDGISVHCLNGRVWTPSSLQIRILEWYHNMLMHVSSTRTLKTIQQTFGWTNIRKHVDKCVKTCKECQRYKIVGRPHYGFIPGTGALRDNNPWEKIQIDCASPWKVNVDSVGMPGEIITYTFHIVTIVDCCTNWCECSKQKGENLGRELWASNTS